ncbi:hypothetical protein ACKWTF_014805 [Chironomus riparius]
MFRKVFIAVFLLKVLELSASGGNTIREFYDKTINSVSKDEYFIRIEDQDCLKEKLKLNNPANEIDRKLKFSDLEIIFKGAGISCRSDIDQVLLKEFNDDTEAKLNIDEDIDLNCLKNELFKLDPNSKLIEGFDPATVANKQEFCQKNLEEVEEGLAALHELELGIEGNNDFRQCTNIEKNIHKMIHYKTLIILSKTVGEENMKAGRKDVIDFQKNTGKAQFECIMNELGK